jgi:hypothetical protein
MAILKEYFEYLKDNPEGYWFKRKLYGWGWTPVRWQGWATLVVYAGLLVLILNRAEAVTTESALISEIGIPAIALTAVLLAICYRTGEKPRWQWGTKK